MGSPTGMKAGFDGGEEVTGSGGNRWRSMVHWGRQLASCRLCRNLTAAAFLAILMIEFVILIPSYRNYEESLLRQHATVAEQAIETYLATKPGPVTAGSLAHLLESSRLTGIQLMAGDRWLRVGEAISEPGDAQGQLRDLKRPSGNRLELAWHEGKWLGDYPVRAQVDVTGVSDELAAFVVRILGLSLLIAIFVTVVAMAVVDRMMLSPLLRLHSRITRASTDAEHPLSYVLQPERNDEFGEVEGAFNSMLKQSASYLNRLRSLNDRLDQLLMERTRSLKRTEQELEIRSLYDQLTGLANRNLFEERITTNLAETNKNDTKANALVVLGLDDFQALNGLAGHQVGDRVLQEVARRLSRFGREPGYVSRLGGDVFGLWLTARSDKPETHLEADIAAVINACAEPVQIGKFRHECYISAGVAVAPMDGGDAQTLLSHAEIAMHRAKKSTDHKVQFFASDFGEQIQRHQLLVRDLRTAVQHRQFELHYQPQFDRRRRCVGYEALLRWRHPVDGLISPAEFIPVAEENGLIIPIGLWVIEEAVATMKRWVDRGFQGRMAVNISARQLADSSLAASIENVLKSHELKPECLELEVTETALMEDVALALDILERFRALGVLLAVDDFGTGYSSLAYLKALPVKRIKIDQAFVTGLPDNQQDEVLCRTMISMAHSLGCEVIAEGVETEAQASWLLTSGCDELQGFLLGRPAPEGYRPSQSMVR